MAIEFLGVVKKVHLFSIKLYRECAQSLHTDIYTIYMSLPRGLDGKLKSAVVFANERLLPIVTKWQSYPVSTIVRLCFTLRVLSARPTNGEVVDGWTYYTAGDGGLLLIYRNLACTAYGDQDACSPQTPQPTMTTCGLLTLRSYQKRALCIYILRDTRSSTPRKHA